MYITISVRPRYLLTVGMFSVVLALIFAPTSASASLIGDSVTIELLSGATSIDTKTETVLSGAGPEFIMNTGSDEQINIDIESSTIQIEFIETLTDVFTFPGGNIVTLIISSLDWQEGGGIVTGASFVGAPSGFGETVQVIDDHTIQVDVDINNQQLGFGIILTLDVQLQTEHGFQGVGGELLPIDTTALLLAGAQSISMWMIPVVVSAIGIGIVIARKL